MFDKAAPIRRLGPLSREHVRLEIQQRVRALQCFRRGNIHDGHLPDALLRAYLMILEDDGKNSSQLLEAGLFPLLQFYIQQRLTEGSAENDGWPLASETNTLAVILFFLLSSQASMQEESIEINSAVLRALAPYTFAGFRYPYTNTDTAGAIARRNPSVTSKHGAYPPPGPEPRSITYFGRPITLQLPPVACFAILSYFARQERRPIPTPPHLPNTRDEANATGRTGPTRDDMEHFVTRCRTQFMDSGLANIPATTRSRRHDPCWTRATRLSNIPGLTPPPIGFYEPGTLEGQWQGSYIPPFLDTYSAWLANAAAPSSFEKFGQCPIYITLREYYCYCPSLPVQLDNNEDGQGEDSWLTTCRWAPSEHDDGIDITDDLGSYTAHYTPLRPERNAEGNLPNNVKSTDPKLLGALHVIVAGKTEDQYGNAWGSYKFIGHIRPSDGLVTLLRDENDPHYPGLGRSILRGYVTSSQNFVGRWRHTYGDADVPPWEAPFSLCKENLQPFQSHPTSPQKRTTLRQHVSYVSRVWLHWRDRMAGRLRRAWSRYNTSPNFVENDAVQHHLTS